MRKIGDKIAEYGLALSAFFMLMLSTACQGDDINVDDTVELSQLSVTLASTITDTDEIESLVSDLAFYLFTQDENFRQKLIMTAGDIDAVNSTVKYTGTAPTGTWNVVVVNNNDELTQPSGNMSSSVMYTMNADHANYPCPEIFYGMLEDVVIIADQTTTDDAELKRNVSRVYVRLSDVNNMVSKTSNVTVQLKDVPSTMTWDGKIYPNVSSPTAINLNSSTLTSWVDNTTYQYTEQEYIIPAHRGENDNDTLQHKMKIYISYYDNHSNLIEHEVEVPKVPVCNGQIRYNLIPSGIGVTITATLLDWYVEDEQNEYIANLSEFECIVVPWDGVREVPIEGVYQQWNNYGGYYYDGTIQMDTSTEVVADVISGNNYISVDIVNRTDSWPRAVLKVTTPEQGSASTAEGIVGIRLSTDASGTYRWKWHVIVDADGTTTCTQHTGGLQPAEF